MFSVYCLVFSVECYASSIQYVVLSAVCVVFDVECSVSGTCVRGAHSPQSISIEARGYGSELTL